MLCVIDVPNWTFIQLLIMYSIMANCLHIRIVIKVNFRILWFRFIPFSSFLKPKTIPKRIYLFCLILNLHKLIFNLVIMRVDFYYCLFFSKSVDGEEKSPQKQRMKCGNATLSCFPNKALGRDNSIHGSFMLVTIIQFVHSLLRGFSNGFFFI